MIPKPLSFFQNSAGQTQVSLGAMGSNNWKEVAEKTLVTEQKKIDTLKTSIQTVETAQKAARDLKSSLAVLQDAVFVLKGRDAGDVFKARSVNQQGGQQSFGVHALSGADEGTYAVQVQQLAMAHKFRSDVQASASTPLNLNGSLVLATSADGSQNPAIVTVTPVDTLATLARKISQTPLVSASVLTLGGGQFSLNVTARQPGQEIFLAPESTAGVVTGLGLGTDDGGNYTVKNRLQPPQQARFLLDGQTITRPGNRISDVLPGIVFELYTPADAATFTVEKDVNRIKQAVTGWVESVNLFQKTLNTSLARKPEDPEGSSGPLAGSFMIRDMAMNLERVLYTPARQGNLKSLYEMGIAPNNWLVGNGEGQGYATREKTFVVDEDKLDHVLLNQLDDVRVFFQGAFQASDPLLEAAFLPDTLQDHEGGVTFSLTAAGGNLVSATNTAGWASTVAHNTIILTAGPAQGMILGCTGTPLSGDIQVEWQVGLMQRLAGLSRGWMMPGTGLLALEEDSEKQTLDRARQNLKQAQEQFRTKLDKKTGEYTRMEATYAKMQSTLDMVRQTSQAWFANK